MNNFPHCRGLGAKTQEDWRIKPYTLENCKEVSFKCIDLVVTAPLHGGTSRRLRIHFVGFQQGSAPNEKSLLCYHISQLIPYPN